MANAIFTFFLRLLKVISFAGILTCCAIALLHFGAREGWRSAAAKLKPVTKVVEVERPKKSLAELLDEVPARFNVPREAVEVILEKEDSRNRREAKRCEWQSAEWKRIAQKITSEPEQQDAYRCSYGPMQVAGWHAPRYGLVWADLLNPEINVEIGVTIYADCFERANGNDLYSRYWQAYRCYNGSGEQAERYANDAMARLTRKIFEQKFTG